MNVFLILLLVLVTGCNEPSEKEIAIAGPVIEISEEKKAQQEVKNRD